MRFQWNCFRFNALAMFVLWVSVSVVSSVCVLLGSLVVAVVCASAKSISCWEQIHLGHSVLICTSRCRMGKQRITNKVYMAEKRKREKQKSILYKEQRLLKQSIAAVAWVSVLFLLLHFALAARSHEIDEICRKCHLTIAAVTGKFQRVHNSTALIISTA